MPVPPAPQGTPLNQRSAAANTQIQQQQRPSILANIFRLGGRRRPRGGSDDGLRHTPAPAPPRFGGQENAAKQREAAKLRDEAHAKKEAELLPAGVRECVICMERPRSTRFGCGHALCCAECANALKRTSNRCPGCRKKIDVAVARGTHLSLEATFIPPAPVEAPERAVVIEQYRAALLHTNNWDQARFR